MDTLKRTNDRKTANLANAKGNGSLIKNAFSLPAGNDYSCPGATSFCQSICYAGKLEKMYPSFRALVLHNWAILENADYDTMVILLSAMIAEFDKDCVKRNAPKAFRIHADGDFFNLTYVKAWSTIIAKHSDIQFWVYTRSDFAAEYLNGRHSNLGLYFSGDPVNIATAKVMESKGINVAMVAPTFAEAKDAIKGARCPEQNGSIPLISEKGGACFACGLCVNGRANVLFSVSKK